MDQCKNAFTKYYIKIAYYSCYRKYSSLTSRSYSDMKKMKGETKLPKIIVEILENEIWWLKDVKIYLGLNSVAIEDYIVS